MKFARHHRFALLLGVLTLSVTPALAKVQRPVSRWVPHVDARKVGGSSEVVVNDIVVLRFREKQRGLSPFERAKRAAESLTEEVAGGDRVAIRVDESDPDQPVLRVGGRAFASASAPSVPKVKSRRRQRRLLRAARASALDQVERWASTLRTALARPGLTVSSTGDVIPLAENRAIRLGGAAHGAVKVTTESGSASVVSWQPDASRNTIAFHGVKPGRDTVYIERDGAVATFSVAVKPYAGQFNVPRNVTVTGTIAPAEMIGKLARVAALTSATLTPGAVVRVNTDSLEVSSLRAGQAATVVVPVRVWGPEMIPVERKVFVPIINRRLATAPTTTLLYSNNPERVTEPQALFTGRLPSDNGIARLLYHHQNAASTSFHFSAELINDSDTPTQVQVVGGDAGPERDTVWVGFRAAADYIAAAENGIGAIVDIPPKMHIALSSLRFPAGQTVSGLMHLRTLSGKPPLIRIIAEPATIVTHMPYLPMPLDNERRGANDPTNFSEHVYPNPSQKLEADYKVGGAWTFIKYGRAGLTASTSPQTILHGNYGVFYDIAVTLQNPTTLPAKARLVFEPSAGMAGGIFLIGDRKVQIPQSNMPTETTLATYTLSPGESRNVTVRTLPLSGSNYPATIIIRP